MVKLKVKRSLSVKIITGVVFVIIIACECHFIHLLTYSMDWINLIIGCSILFITLYFVLESPVFIEMNETSIVLHKLKRRLVINYDHIYKVEYYKPDRSEVRLFGSGGFLGFVGKFKNKTIGTYQSYVGDYSDSFLIQTKENENYVLSCENRDLVIKIINAHIKS